MQHFPFVTVSLDIMVASLNGKASLEEVYELVDLLGLMQFKANKYNKAAATDPLDPSYLLLVSIISLHL